MSSVTTTGPADDGPPPPPPPIATPFDLWDPFGDPGALRRAADAWLGAADHLDRTSAHLGEMAATVYRGWSGEAQDAFAGRNAVQRDALLDAAAGFRDVAAHLQAVAEELEVKNDLVQSIYVTIATTAGVSVLAGAVSFGAGFLLGSASIAANVARAQQVLAGVRAFLMASRTALVTAKATRLGAFGIRFAAFAAQGTVATASVKHVALDQDVLDADSWGRGDLAGIVLGGAASAGLVFRGATPAGTPWRAAVTSVGADAGASALADLLGGGATRGQVVTNAVFSAAGGRVMGHLSSPRTSSPYNQAHNLGLRRGTVHDLPADRRYQGPADNLRGKKYQPDGKEGAVDLLRIMDPTVEHPRGRIIVHGRSGQPLNEFGKPGSKAETHFDIDERVRWPGWPDERPKGFG